MEDGAELREHENGTAGYNGGPVVHQQAVWPEVPGRQSFIAMLIGLGLAALGAFL